MITEFVKYLKTYESTKNWKPWKQRVDFNDKGSFPAGFVQWGDEFDDNDSSYFRLWGKNKYFPKNVYCYEPGDNITEVCFYWFDDDKPGYYQESLSAVAGINYMNSPENPTSKNKKYLGDDFKSVKLIVDLGLEMKKYNI